MGSRPTELGALDAGRILATRAIHGDVVTLARAVDVARICVLAPFVLLAILACDVALRAVWFALGPAVYERFTAHVMHAVPLVLRLLFRTRIRVHGAMPRAVHGRPFIVVANHQPPVDFLLLARVLDGPPPAYVTRSGMDRGIPCISFFLRASRSVTLVRGNPDANRAALRELGQRMERMEKTRRSVAIFPEGLTGWGRATPRPFLRSGLCELLGAAPSAVVVPVVFSGTEPLIASREQWLPRCGVTLEAHVLPPVERAGVGDADVIDACERAIHGLFEAASTARAHDRRTAPRPVCSSSRMLAAGRSAGDPWT
jgi:1-acyl-sn-glycerol-3-phosphate acyltransferase